MRFVQSSRGSGRSTAMLKTLIGEILNAQRPTNFALITYSYQDAKDKAGMILHVLDEVDLKYTYNHNSLAISLENGCLVRFYTWNNMLDNATRGYITDVVAYDHVVAERHLERFLRMMMDRGIYEQG